MLGQIEFSTREEQILRLIAAGMTDKQVALRLGISRKTVATHLGRLYTRGGYHSRTEAVVGWLGKPRAGTSTERPGPEYGLEEVEVRQFRG
jgi:DNA-binding CsgD family transcriptional regulator